MSEKIAMRLTKIKESIKTKKFLFSALMLSLAVNVELLGIIQYLLEKDDAIMARFWLILFSVYALILSFGAFEKPRRFYKKIVNLGCKDA